MIKKFWKWYCTKFGHSFIVGSNVDDMWLDCKHCGFQKDFPEERYHEGIRQIQLGILDWKE